LRVRVGRGGATRPWASWLTAAAGPGPNRPGAAPEARLVRVRRFLHLSARPSQTRPSLPNPVATARQTSNHQVRQDQSSLPSPTNVGDRPRSGGESATLGGPDGARVWGGGGRGLWAGPGARLTALFLNPLQPPTRLESIHPPRLSRKQIAGVNGDTLANTTTLFLCTQVGWSDLNGRLDWGVDRRKQLGLIEFVGFPGSHRPPQKTITNQFQPTSPHHPKPTPTTESTTAALSAHSHR